MARPAPAVSAATIATMVSPRSVETNSLIGAPPDRPGEWAVGGSAGSSSTPSLISRPCEVSTPIVPLAVDLTAETITSCADLGSLDRPGREAGGLATEEACAMLSPGGFLLC